jgi:hypothetical protein
MTYLPLLMHTYPSVTPENVWDLEIQTFDLLVNAAKQNN